MALDFTIDAGHSRETSTTSPALKRVLFATDFSEHSLKALPLLSALVRSCAVELFIVHLITPTAYNSIPCDSISWGVGELCEEANIRMTKLLRSAVLTGIPIAGTTIMQGTAETLGRIATKLDIDLLALGIHGCNSSQGSRLGSFAAHAVRQAPCPLLLL